MTPNEIVTVIHEKQQFVQKLGHRQYLSTESDALLSLHDVVTAFLGAIEASPSIMKEMSMDQVHTLNKLYRAVGR